jgi:hypothetical protein
MRLVAIAALLLLTRCPAATAPRDDVRVLGAIAGYNQDDPRIRITTAPGVATVTVTTYGGGCHRKGETEVQLRGRKAVITPYDYTAPPGSVCTQPLLAFQHVATLDFGAPGGAHIVVHGMDDRQGKEITVERTVTIP